MASALQGASDGVHGRGDPRDLSGNRCGDLSIGSVHHLQNLRRGQRVEEAGFRIWLFGQQVGKHGLEADQAASYYCTEAIILPRMGEDAQANTTSARLQALIELRGER